DPRLRLLGLTHRGDEAGLHLLGVLQVVARLAFGLPRLFERADRFLELVVQALVRGVVEREPFGLPRQLRELALEELDPPPRDVQVSFGLREVLSFGPELRYASAEGSRALGARPEPVELGDASAERLRQRG